MKNKFLLSLTISASVLFLYSCQDFLDVNLAKKSITVLAPANNAVTTDYTQTFWWEEVKGADRYNLQIVKPNFSNVQRLLLDTTVKTLQFSFGLAPGIYQWRVKAMNSTSSTDYVVHNITIDTSLNLASQQLILISPQDNKFVNNLTQNFTWYAMPNATSYLFQVLLSNTPIHTETLTTASFAYTFPNEGTFTWRVSAQNNLTNSPPTARTITIDTTRPAVPVPIFPIADTTSANPIPLKWNCTALADSSHLQISTDSTFAIVTTKDTVIINTANPIIYNFYGALSGHKYFWTVKAADKAGNTSSYFYRRRIKRN